MKQLTFELIIAFLTLSFTSVWSEWDKNFSVKIEDDVPIESCSKILSNLELLLTKTSEKLHSVTDGRLTIDHFDIRLPDIWAKSATCLQSRNVVASNQKSSSDFTVIQNSQKSNPWALQYGQCKVKGRQLFFPSSALISNSQSLLNITFQEFAKFQFGIFLDNQTQLEEQSFCNSSDCNYDGEAPTRQNLLCRGQSPLEVVLSSCNSNETSSGCEPRPFRPPTFTFSTSSDSLTILVIDRMINSQDESTTAVSWEIVQNAFFLFVAKLPAGSALSIVTYGSEATLNLSPTLVTKSNAAELFAKIPRRHLNSAQKFAESCSRCGLKMALKIASSSSSRLNPSIILLSKIPFYPTIEEFENLPPIYSIGLTSSITQSPVAQIENVKTFVLPECSQSGECLFALSQILASVSREIREEKKFFSSFFRRKIETDGTKPVSGRFSVPENLRENVWIVLTSNDEKDVESFELTDPTGRRYQFPKYEHGLSYFALEGQRPAGDWSYTVKLYETSEQVVQLDVAAQGRDVVPSVTGWTHVDEVDSSKVFIYAQVDVQHSSQNEVVVRAIVHRPSMEPVEIPLRDFGTGYPDLKTGDGIYSAYFTKFSPEPGHYHVEIIASSKTFERFTIADSFYAEQATGFYIREGSSVPVNDVFPPSRITDFKVQGYLEDSHFVYISWSAPGGDYDSGRALRYEIRCSTNRESLHNDRYPELTILVDASLVPTPAEYGEQQDCTVGVPWPGQTFYYGIVAFDEAGNRGEISNVVSVRIDKKEEPSVTLLPFVDETSTELTNLPHSSNEKTVGKDYSLIAYVTCSLLLVSAILSFSIWRIVRHLKRRSKCVSARGDISDKGSSTHDDSQCNPNNITTEDIWSLTSRSDDKSPKNNLHFVSESRHTLQSEFLYNDLDLLKDVDLLSSLVLPPRDSVLEDMSVYRDLSNLDSQSLDYFALSRRLSNLLYCDEDSRRRESLV